jgi:hypothetical protein
MTHARVNSLAIAACPSQISGPDTTSPPAYVEMNLAHLMPDIFLQEANTAVAEEEVAAGEMDAEECFAAVAKPGAMSWQLGSRY